MSTCLETSMNDIYAINGLGAEVGEINDKIAKWVRKGEIAIDDNNIIVLHTEEIEDVDTFIFSKMSELAKEVGDVLWFVALCAQRLGYSLEDIAEMNVEKLATRKKNGTIVGNGDGVTAEERCAK